MSLNIPQKRKLVPNWRSVLQTVENRELDHSLLTKNKVDNYSIIEYHDNWIENKTISHAGEYLSASVSNLAVIDEDLYDAAKFVINNEEVENNSSLKRLALSIIQAAENNEKKVNETTSATLPTKEEYSRDISKRIKGLREYLSINYRDAIAHIEISLAFLLNGNWSNAVRHAIIASSLEPENRYITRCAVRCLTHVGDADRAHNILSRNSYISIDPWLIASDITVDMLRGKSPRNYRRAMKIKDNHDYSPHSISEMLMALATLESQNGTNIKQIKRLTAQAMIDPLDNSLAQARWLSSKTPGLFINTNESNIKFNFESDTLEAYENRDFEKAFKNAYLWFHDSSFSRRATLTASNIATTYTDHKDEGIAILELGLVANPNSPELLNNLAYHHILSNDIEKGEQFLNLAKTQKTSNHEIEICILATEGLLQFRNNRPEKGRNIYRDAIQKAIKYEKGKSSLSNSAIINLTREETLSGLITIDQAMRNLDSIKTDNFEIQYDILKAKQIIESNNGKRTN